MSFKSFFTLILALAVHLTSRAYAHLYPDHYYPAADLKKPTWVHNSKLQPLFDVSFVFNIGCGFLYFYQVQGNLTPAPSALFSNFSGADLGNVKRFGYNRTPMYEANIGTRIFHWLKASLTYYGQSNVNIQSDFNTSVATGSSNNPVWASFRSSLQLNSILLKCYFENPYSLVFASWAANPYLALGVGPSWQSWTNLCVYEITINNGTYTSSLLSLRQKISANVTWTGELGLTFKPATPSAPLSIQIGCRYIDWGRSSRLGVLQQQGTKVGPFKPISVKKVYSFTPFLGVRFDF